MAIVYGTTGYNYISDSHNGDIIDGRGGSDDIKALGNNQTIVFRQGYGQYTITNIRGNNTLYFGPGITSDNLQFIKDKGNLFIRIKNTTDKVEIENWYDTSNSYNDYKIGKIVFSNGTSLSLSQIESRINTSYNVYVGTMGKDVINTHPNTNNLIYCKQGNNSVVTHGGNNIIEAGSGTNSVYNLNGGNNQMYCEPGGSHYYEDHGGTNQYIYMEGDTRQVNASIQNFGGNDSINFQSGISESELTFTKAGNNLQINISDPKRDKLTIDNWFKSSSYQIGNWIFADGTDITASEIDKAFSQTNKSSITIADINTIIQSTTAFAASTSSAVLNAPSSSQTQNTATIIANHTS